MTEEAKTCFEVLKKAAHFGVANCQLCPAYPVCPTGTAGWNNECMLETTADLIESLSDQLEQVTRERDAAVEDLSAHRPCDACGFYELQGNDCMRCRRYTERPMWEWRGVEANQ